MTVASMALSEFLAKADLLQLLDRLASEDIDMTVLPLLNDGDLRELGLSLGQRRKLLSGLKALKDHAGSEPKTNTPIQLRRLSVMFCDMVGSTELGERLGIEDMQVVLQHYHDIAAKVAQQHEGHLAGAQGDGLVMLFGYPKVIEGFAERCVIAANDLQNRLAEAPVCIDGIDPLHIATRIGIASGQAAVGFRSGDGSGDQTHLVGPVVNRAARLQTVAKPLSCAVDDRTRDLTQGSVAYADAERHSLKGLSDAVDVYHLLGLRRSWQRPVMPSLLVGRDAELATLSDMWTRARNGATVTLTVSADAGLGKSTLVQSFLASLVLPPARRVHLRCSGMAAQSPLGPVADALLEQLDRQEGQTLSSLLNAPTPTLADLAARFLHLVDNPTEPAAASAGDRDAILDLLSTWLIGAGDVPGIVVVENAQWADDTTRALMAFAAGKARDKRAPILMIALSRDDGPDYWGTAPEQERLVLQALSRPDAETVLDLDLAGVPVPEAVRQNILYHADGNPLMINALAQAQAQHASPEVADAVLVPHTIYEAVSKRLDSILSGRGLMEALAVFGEPTHLHVLNDAFPLDDETGGTTLDALEAAGMIERRRVMGSDMVSIRHKAYRDVIYEQIDGQVRRKLHAAAFRALQDDSQVQPEILAKHAQAARDWANTSDYALTTGETFLKRSALVEAGHFLEMAEAALRRLPASRDVAERRLRAVTGLASVERSRFGIATDRSGELGQQAAELARSVGDGQAELLALNGVYSHALVRAEYPKAEKHARALLEAAELSQSKTFVMIASRAIGAVAMHRGDQETGRQWLGAALEQYDVETHLPLAHAHGYDHAEITATLLSMSLWISGDLQRARQTAAFSIDHSRKIGHAHSLAQAVSFRVMCGAMARHADLSNLAAEGLAVAEKQGIIVMRAAIRLFPFASDLCLQASAPSASDLAELDRRVQDFRAANPFNYGPLLAGVLADVYLRAGDVDAAEAELLDGMKTAARTGETWTSSELFRMQARVAAARNDDVTALGLRREALECAMRTQAFTIALRIACDAAEADPGPETMRAVQHALSRMVSLDDGWDVRRARALLDGAGTA
jgi:class 3 adenylate cyclase